MVQPDAVIGGKMKQIEEWSNEKHLWFGILLAFNNSYECPDCIKVCATYWEKCKNPMHRLHDALYALEDELEKLARQRVRRSK
jgi:hypothetical protein